MPTYYEIIELPVSATQNEIEQVLDLQYNKCRRLVTHHDPNVVAQATQVLQLLEKIRATLMDPGLRSAYDAAIGLDNHTGSLGGLSDPMAAPAAQQPQPFAPRFAALLPSQPVTQAPPRALPPTTILEPQGWICPKCKASNVVNSQFCKSCGETLASSCPSCSILVEKGAQFCTKCGVSIEEAQRKKEMEALMVQLRGNLAAVERNVPVPEQDIKQLGGLVVRDMIWAVVSLLVSLLSWLTLPGSLPGISLAAPVVAGLNGSETFLYELGATLPLLGTLGLLAALFVLFSVLHRVFPLLTAIGAGLATLVFLCLPASTYAAFEIFGFSQGDCLLAGWVSTIVFFPILLARIPSAANTSAERLHPYYKWIPNPGCLGFLLGWVFQLLPALYVVYAILYVGEQIEQLSILVSEYGQILLVLNGVLFAIAALFLFIYALLVWRTAQGVEARYKQNITSRTETLVKLTQQIRSLEQALAGIVLRPV